MKIPKEYLSEKNYEGTKLIAVTDKKVFELKKKLNELQKNANPYLLKMDKLAKVLDPYYMQINQLNEKIKSLREEMKSKKEEYDEELAKVQAIDAKAQLIKNKMQPLIDKNIADKLEEFDRPLHATEKDGVIYVEVTNDLEDTIKNIRARNAKKVNK